MKALTTKMFKKTSSGFLYNGNVLKLNNVCGGAGAEVKSSGIFSITPTSDECTTASATLTTLTTTASSTITTATTTTTVCSDICSIGRDNSSSDIVVIAQ
jgi:hypothetical protein